MALGVFRSWLVAFPGARAFAHQIDVLRVPHPVGADQSYLINNSRRSIVVIIIFIIEVESLER